MPRLPEPIDGIRRDSGRISRPDAIVIGSDGRDDLLVGVSQEGTEASTKMKTCFYPGKRISGNPPALQSGRHKDSLFPFL